MSHALNNLGTARLIADDPAGWDDLERSLQIALDDDYQEHVARAYTNLSSTAVAQRMYERATAIWRTASRTATSTTWTPGGCTCSRSGLARDSSKSIGTAPAKTWKWCCAIGVLRR